MSTQDSVKSPQTVTSVGQPENLVSQYRTIKHNHLFLIDDYHGMIPYDNNSGLGLYHLDTRFLSCLEIELHHTQPVPLLSSSEKGYLSTLVYTNIQFQTHTVDEVLFNVLPETIQLKRESVLNGSLFENYSLTSYNELPIKIQLSFKFDADFRDIFDVRNILREVRGTVQQSYYNELGEQSELVFPYLDRTGQVLETHIIFSDILPEVLPKATPPTVVYEIVLFPRQPVVFHIEVRTMNCSVDTGLMDLPVNIKTNDEALAELETRNKHWRTVTMGLSSDNEDFNEMMARSHKDIQMLLTRTVDGAYVAAGIPWYVSLFGRDSLITSRFCLMLYPEIARNSLRILAKFQGKNFDPWRDEEPGKILHEFRVGELARMQAIPHTPYYGSVDATPLWIILLYEYVMWTNDTDLLQELWPNAVAAMDWIDCNMDSTPLGYSVYCCQSSRGIFNQGWKDSHNSVMDLDGSLAEPPVALVEVQGYVYLAKKYMARLAKRVGDHERIMPLIGQMEDLKSRFNQDFWMEDAQFYAIALDKDGRQMRTISSNPGHCLETGILDEERAHIVADRLMQPDIFNGWGIRTLSGDSIAYNPMSYHNGSIWPHDNAIIAKGMAEIGRRDYAEKVITGIYEAARHMNYLRLPELFCGFGRDKMREGDPPVRYPVACSPQAWAAGCMYSMIQSMLNFTPDAETKTLSISRPMIPSWLNRLQLLNLRIGNACLDLEFRRTQKIVIVDVLERQGDLDIKIEI